ncbi:carboxypeptidase-like regulatory domain-containing protein [Dysgonomonas sp. Marseille-P4677]|uniref:carboxypeptidase-like regulatory domain-containing protein n=1 Tax=Dysgonomonas sp. Marseille-P4677 TaxID=2364790 RepID=UPI001914C5A9|nr:carboxypeptidase-like regulatory domain-containing protein [Dysgonomonas sp. Marseille-P4677]MBK5721435.1 carboxypeptidase-like regulatory domain-containing protein [Dysgonomonas sp. Marseille-P4677]
MKLKSYNILFRILSYLSDRTNGAPIFVKYKLLLGTLIIGIAGTTAHAQKKAEVSCYDTIPLCTPKNKELTTKNTILLGSQSNKNDSLIEKKGRVKDEHGEFIAGVSIVVKGTKNGAVSDINGAFSIKAKSTDKLIFSFVGMESREMSVSTMRGGEVIITMKDSDMILCYEVVVVRHYPDDIYRRTPKKVTKLPYTEVQTVPVSPVGNLESFQKWVQNNIQYSEQMKKDKLKGEVILSFAIDKKGKLVDKKVIGKLSKEADKEALRALSLSEAWKPGINYDGKPIKTTMTISINFGNE